jgi:HEAT repeat protein
MTVLYRGKDVMEGRSPGDLEAAAASRDVGYLLEALRDPAFEVRKAAARGLGEAGGEKANLALLSVARDRWGERPEVRITALRSLGRIHERDRYMSILQKFIAGDNKKVMAAAREMLREVDPAGFPRLLAASGALDHAAIRVYGTTGEPSAVALLGRFLDDARQAGHMANIGGPDAVKALRRLVTELERYEVECGDTLKRGRIDKIMGAARDSLQLVGDRPGDQGERSDPD